DHKWKGNLVRLFILLALLGSFSMFYTTAVRVKMLPLDNKPEFNVVINLPEGVALPSTANVVQQMGQKLLKIPEVTAIQTYAGTASPFNFNGLVRHYYMRRGSWEGDIQVQLLDKHERERTSHDIAVEARKVLAPLAKKLGARIAVVEMPPGPPVLQTMVAEVYGPSDSIRRQVARDLTGIFEKSDIIVDADNYMPTRHKIWRFKINGEKAERRGVSRESINRQLEMIMGGYKLGDAKLGHELEPRFILLQAPLNVRGEPAQIGEVPVRASDGSLIPISELGRFVEDEQDDIIFHKDLRPLEYVVGEVSGRLAAPVYGMMDVSDLLKEYTAPDGVKLEGYLIGPPPDSFKSAFEWTGEWTVTYETFRDMGIAFMAALVLIYMLVVWEFGNFRQPGIIMAPIPLTLIGIIPGHWLLNAEFTATSMIGWIALAGIIVRNSILLVDFAKHAILDGVAPREAVIQAVRTRTRPILITQLTMIAGASTILSDQIFQGMAISLMFGAIVSTLLTLIVIPLSCMRSNKAFLCEMIASGQLPPEATSMRGVTSEKDPDAPGLLSRLFGALSMGFYLIRAIFVMIG
ncbi:MAG TPA: efflux RND transporter permease subunit, partial [Rhizobiales bacterium]|nr:efflux RND transporter permease subunit [Hyphomicrobiales bacterium]